MTCATRRSKGTMPVLRSSTSEQLGTMHVPRSKICPSAQACIFVLDIDWAAWGGRQRGMFASPGLNAGLLVGAQHVVARPQGCALPTTLIKVQDWARLGGEGWVAWKYPAAMAPRSQGVLAEPAPQRGA